MSILETLFLNFSLPHNLIATTPSRDIGDDRMMVCDGSNITDDYFTNFVSYLQEGDLLIFNNSRVFKAALDLFGEDGVYVSEILLVQQCDDRTWSVLLKKSRKFRVGTKFFLKNSVSLEIEDISQGGMCFVRFSQPFSLSDADLIGRVPIPPYIAKERKKRNEIVKDELDAARYQTIFAKFDGSVAAPTASLRFSHSMMQLLDDKGIKSAEITLHIGPGTFKLMQEEIDNFVIHSEFVELSQSTSEQIQSAKAQGKRVIAIGTTACRALESSRGEYFKGWTNLFITPGYDFKIVDGLLTNFHLPRSTLLLLVQSFIGIKNTKDMYKHAIENLYRFYSYGDGMFLYKQ